MLSSNASTENLETAENWVVTKPKKKSKKRRNSISSGGRRQNSTSESSKQPSNRAPSPDLRGNATRSMPHSEKSNDSSDVDSVHSLPIDDLNMPISYADIAKNSEKLKEKKPSPEKPERIPLKEKSPCSKTDQDLKVPQNSKKLFNTEKSPSVEKNTSPHPTCILSKSPPDVNNFKNFPAISPDSKITSVVPPNTKYQDSQDDKNMLEAKPNLDVITDIFSPTTAALSPDVVSNPKAAPSDPPHQQIPKIIQDIVNSKSIPPDVHNIRSFPAMPNTNKNFNVSEKNNTKNSNVINKIRNVSPGNNHSGNSKSAKIGQNNNNSLKSSARNISNTVHNDIQIDLTVSTLLFLMSFFDDNFFVRYITQNEKGTTTS